MICETFVELLKPRPKILYQDLQPLIKPLRVMLRNPNAGFMSQGQAEATSAVLNKFEDILILMGTGSGKTLSILLPVHMEGPKCCTIVIIHFVSLMKELEERCRVFGISTGSWGDRHLSFKQVYIFAVEQVTRDDFQAFLRILQSKGRLQRIVFDEAHVSVTDDDYR